MSGIYAAKKHRRQSRITSSLALQQLRPCIKLTTGFYCTCNYGALIQDVQMMRGSASVRPDDIVNGSREATLGLLWNVFLQFQASWHEPCLGEPLETVWQPLLVAPTSSGCHSNEQ